MTEKLILQKLEGMETKMDKMESAISLLAVQSERLNNVSNQVENLWKKHDEISGPTGLVNELKNFQAGCPRDYIKQTLDRQWVVIGLLASIVSGAVLKAFGAI